MKLQFRDLKANEIDVRVSQCTDKGVVLLLYKDARCDMRILDETIGAENWQREHYECKGNLFCRVGIKCNNDWIWKSDCGTESYTEKQKGEASDSFKRACFNWGIGRELYTAPFIFVSFEKGDAVKKVKNNKPTTSDKFKVEKIVIDNGQITAISIINTTLKKRAFVWQKKADK